MTIRQRLKDIYVDLDGTATFTCELSEPGIPVEWSHNGNPIPNSRNYKITSRGNVHKLSIKRVAASDVGKWKVSYQDLHDSASLILRIPGEYSHVAVVKCKACADYALVSS